MKDHLKALVLWTFLWALFFSPLLLGAARLPNSDLLRQFHAFALFQSQTMGAGHLPVWSPGSFAGFPFAADSQAAVFYPLRWLSVLAGGPAFPFYVLQLEGLLHIWLAGVFTYALAFDITRSRWGALLAAGAFGFGGYLISYPLLQLALLETIVWLPLVLLLLRRATAVPRPLPLLLAGGGVLGFSFLAGHPQTFLQAAFLAAAYYLFCSWRVRWRVVWVFGGGLVVAATAVGVAAAAWLPALHYLQFTTRSAISYEFVAKGFPLLDYIQIIAPGTLSFWVPMYGGLVTLALTFVAWWGRRDGTREAYAEILFWSGTAVVTAVLSLGDKGMLFALTYRLVPGMSLFRQQERWVNGVSLSLALLAAQGFALWWQSSPARRRQWWRQATAVLLGILALVVIILLLAAPIAVNDWSAILWRQAFLLVVLVGLLWWGVALTRGWRWQPLALLLLLVADLVLAAQTSLDLQPGSARVFWPQPAWLALLESDEPVRIDSSRLFPANVGEVYGLEDVRGISPLKLQVLDELDDLPPARLWQLLNVGYVLSAEPLAEPGLVEIGRIDTGLLPGEPVTGYIYQNTAVRPRAWMAYAPVAAADAAAARQLVSDPAFDPAQQVVLTALPPEMAPPTTEPQVTVTRLAPHKLTITVDTETPGLLVISEWAYPGWQATVDGMSTPLLTANYALQAIPLAAGIHTVRLQFVPKDVYAGLVVTAVTLLLALALAWKWKPVVSYRALKAVPPEVVPLPAGRTPAFIPVLSVNQWRLLAVLIMLLAFALRLFHLGAQELRGDEAFSYLFANQPPADIVSALVREGDPHSPLHYLLLYGWMAMTGDSEFAMRFLTLIPGLLTLPLLMLLGRRMGGWPVAVGVGLLAALSQSVVWISQDVRNQYMLATFFTLLATWLLLQLTDPARAGPRHRFLLWLAYTLTIALAIYSYYYSIFAVVAHGLYIFASAPRRRWLWPWCASGAAAGLLFLPWLLMVWRQLLGAGQLSDPARPELAQYLTAVGSELTVGPSLGSSLGRWLFAGGLALCLWGAWRLWRTNRAWAWLLVGWLGSAALFIYLIQFRRATFNTFYITVAFPAWWLLVAVGLQALWQRTRWGRWLALAGLIILLAANVWSLQHYYFVRDFSRDVGYREMAARITAVQEPGDLFLAHFPDPSLRYYLRHLDLPYQMLPEEPDASTADTEAALTELAEQVGRIWFVPYKGWDREGFVPLWLQYHTLNAEQMELYKLTLQAFRPFAAADEVLRPVNAALADGGISLESMYVTIDGRAAPPSPDNVLTVVGSEPVAITLVWQADQAVPTDYAAFVHLLAPDDTLIAQHDGIPVWGTRPTTTWQPGDRIFDQHALVLPGELPAAGAQLVVGLYRTDNQERAFFADGREALPLLTLVGNE